MATAPSSPILIWTPGGGVPVGPVSNPPVYSQAGITRLINGQSYVDVVFGSTQTTPDWVLVECEVVNTTDGAPLNIWPGIVTSKLTTGFRLQLNGKPDSNNYYLHWAVSGVNITPVPATTYQLSGDSSAAFGVNGNFSVQLPPSTTLPGILTVTPNDGGAGGTFSPTSVVLTQTSAVATFTYTAASYGAKTISVTNSGTLSNPAPLTFTCIAPTYTLTGPSTGDSGTPSTNFTVALAGGASLPTPVTVTPSAGGGGGTFTPITVVLTTGSPSATFTYTPASVGVKTISVTNDGGLANPANLTYTATTPPFDPTTIAGLKLWLKADSLALSDGTAVSTWNDSSGLANNATGTTTTRPIYKTNIVNAKPVVRFDGVDDFMQLGTEIVFAGDSTLVIVYQTSGDCCMVGGTTTNFQWRIGLAGANTLHTYAGGIDAESTTLAAPRTAWNIAAYRSASGTMGFVEAGTSRGSGGGTPTHLGTIGKLGTPSALFTTGDIAEVLVYDNAISFVDLEALSQYLGTKYGITVALLRALLEERIT